MFVAIHRLRAASSSPADAVRRSIGLASWTPGLRAVELLQDLDGDECVVVSRWDAEQHFERWRRAASFVAAQRARDAVDVELRRYEARLHACRACERKAVPGSRCN